MGRERNCVTMLLEPCNYSTMRSRARLCSSRKPELWKFSPQLPLSQGPTLLLKMREMSAVPESVGYLGGPQLSGGPTCLTASE